ncbi:EAL domain-containing protein [Luteimonas sp. S4-F44]|uniref:putative bifunctional diguanylate cyclase/phosphodiesterase n=1 Tax=Luteimonas sp. S4-F44 TaxID=2925842 RepID=UPI001F5376DF|nr:EAL domain-containing protein [Luteimonas sp. S4-F44]UNK43103.1 EAL domain-containing protein [Luteimonas sp. S4-F44]
MIVPSSLHVPVTALLTALLVLCAVLALGRQRRRARSYPRDERAARLNLALWATGERDWDYDMVSGEVRHTVCETDPHGEAAVEHVMPIDALLHPEDRPLAREALARYIAGDGEGQLQLQLRVVIDGGDWRWVRVRGRAVARGRDGAILRIAGTALDITGTRAAEREHRIAAEVLRSMREAVAVIDAGFRYVSVNPAFLRMTGYTESEVLGQDARLLDDNPDGEDVSRHLREEAARHGHWSGELRQRRKDGEQFLAAVECRTVYDADMGQPLHVFVLNDITHQKRAEQELRYLANFDTLTSLPNRSLLSERLSRAIARARDNGHRIAVLFLDLDRFKDINDSLGHAAGDRILCAAATRVQQTVGMHHTVARLGGDEFTIVIENLDEVQAADRMAREIIHAFEAPLRIDDRRQITISPSLGISVYPDHARGAIELLKQADIAMYQAKAAGRRTFKRYDDAMDIAARRRTTLTGALREVLDRGELRLVMQPRHARALGGIACVEALLRWNSPTLGEIPPSEFIPIAEESGLIHEIGEWVLREACRTVLEWRRQGLADIAVSVNVSLLQLLRGDFPGVVRRVLEEVGFPPEGLELELTESVLMADAEHAAARLQALRTMGVSLAIDDFGTGYSSLAYLKRLPITTIKIDKAFVAGLPDDREDAAITATVISLAHALGLRVVAEGVETEAQLRFLTDRHCDELQGYWISRPLPPAQCLAFVRAHPAGAAPLADSHG